MKYDGYDVKPYQAVQLDPPDIVYGAEISDLRRYQGTTVGGFMTIPERDAAVREWIERQERKPVIVPGPVVRSVKDAWEKVSLIEGDLKDLQRVFVGGHPWPRDCYDDDANYQHGVRIAEQRRELLRELIGSYRAELGVIQSQLKELGHGGS